MEDPTEERTPEERLLRTPSTLLLYELLRVLLGRVSVERRVEAALERFTLERVAEELERTVDELLVPTTRRVDVPVLLRLT